MAEIKEKPSKRLAIAGLILNIVVLPGLGTIIAGKGKIGGLQVLFYLLGLGFIFAFREFVFLIVLIGVLLIITTWIWALVTSIQMIKNAQ